MGKVQVYNLAKELHTTSNHIMTILAELKIEAKSHMSWLEEKDVKKVKKAFGAQLEDKGTKAKKNEDTDVKMKNGPRIVRKVEVFIDEDESEPAKEKPVSSKKVVEEVEEAPAMPRLKKKAKPVEPKPEEEKLEVKLVKKADVAEKKEQEIEAKPEVKVEKEPEVKAEAKTEEKPEPKPEQKVEIKEEKPAETKKKEAAPNRPQDRFQGERPNRPQDRFQGERPNRPQDRFQGERPNRNGRPQGDKKGFDKKFNGEKGPQGNDRKQFASSDKKGFNGDRRQKNDDVDIPKASMIDEPQRSSDDFVLSRSKEKEKSIKKEQRKDTVRSSVSQNKNSRQKTKAIAKGISSPHDEDLDDLFANGGRIKRQKKVKKPVDTYIPPKATLTHVTLPAEMTVKEFSEIIKKTSGEVIKKLILLGVMATINSVIDFDTATLIASEYGIDTEQEVVVSQEDILFDDTDDDESELVPRDPVVVVMGHVDHGKTSLLDAIRNANVIAGEAGGITQHIGAYKVRVNDRNICFLDTPGHEAFTAMRARGAQVTDVAVLVVAADDGVMPQTIEAINHAKAAGVKIVVAVNKIDKEAANPDRVKQELTEHGVITSEWGGDTEFVEVSAKFNKNIDELLEIILLEADVLELKANPNKQGKGTVIESRLDKSKGAVATLLVQRGTVKTGDAILSGTTFGRIRAMVDDKGRRIKKAGPSTPVEIIGLPDVVEAGDIFYVVEDEKTAKSLVDRRIAEEREKTLKSKAKVSLDDLFAQIQEGEMKELNLVVKADVAGSIEAVKQSIEKLSNEEVRVRVVHGGVGAITESDVTLASVSNAIIIGFNVRPGLNVAEMAEEAGVDMRMYRVIYHALEDIKAAMVGMLDPEFKEVVQGHLEVRQTYKVSSVGTIAGSYVLDGKITRNSQVRVVRDGIVVNEGNIASLKRFKDDAKEVQSGYECGVLIENFNDIKEGDIIESFIMEEIERK